MIGANLHEHFDALAFQGIGHANGRSLCDCGMRHQRAFHLGRADAVSGDVEHVVVAAQHRDVTVFVPHRNVARHIAAGNNLPVAFVAGRVAPNGAQHVRKRTL